MKKHRFILSPDDEVIVMQIGMLANQVLKASPKAPPKFGLAEKAAELILIGEPITLNQFNGLADTAGGYFCGVEALYQRKQNTIQDLKYAKEFLLCIERLKKQIKFIELVR